MVEGWMGGLVQGAMYQGCVSDRGTMDDRRSRGGTHDACGL